MSHGTERVGRGSDLSRLDVNVRSWYFCAGDRLGSSEVAGTAGIVRAGNGAGHRRSTVHDAVRGLPTALLPGPGGGHPAAGVAGPRGTPDRGRPGAAAPDRPGARRAGTG